MAWMVLRGVMFAITEQSVALRFVVVLADSLYDKDLPLFLQVCLLTKVFTEEMLAGGYQKYFRAVSRLTALAREGMLGEEVRRR